MRAGGESGSKLPPSIELWRRLIWSAACRSSGCGADESQKSRRDGGATEAAAKARWRAGAWRYVRSARPRREQQVPRRPKDGLARDDNESAKSKARCRAEARRYVRSARPRREQQVPRRPKDGLARDDKESEKSKARGRAEARRYVRSARPRREQQVPRRPKTASLGMTTK